MASVFDVAEYILQKQGAMTAMKLQKLCYYSHAWHLVWDEEPLFSERIEAWANGPVVPALYNAHRGQFSIEKMPDWTRADVDNLIRPQRESVNAVLGYYGPKGAHELSQLTHAERPWAEARKGLPAGARSNVAITDSAMAAFYDSLTPSADQT